MSACEAKLKGRTHGEIGIPNNARLHELAVHAAKLGFRVVESWLVRGVRWMHGVLGRQRLRRHELVAP